MASGIEITPSVSRRSDVEMDSVCDATFESSKLVCLFEDLKAIGMEGRFQLPKRENKRQYVICGVFSRDEIESSGKYRSHINRFTKYLLSLNDQNKDGKFGSKFLCNGRLAVLLNNLGRHGEARLFDPDGSLLRELGIIRPENNITEKRRYLDEMKQRFTKEFGTGVEPYIVLLSYLIPCTVQGYECARLIREYVKLTKDKLIISYDYIWHGTDEKLSLQQLTHDNISVVTPSPRQEHVNKETMKLEEDSTSGSSNPRRLSSCEDEFPDDLDLLDISPRSRKPTNKWPTVAKLRRPVDEKKKRRSYSRYKYEN